MAARSSRRYCSDTVSRRRTAPCSCRSTRPPRPASRSTCVAYAAAGDHRVRHVADSPSSATRRCSSPGVTNEDTATALRSWFDSRSRRKSRSNSVSPRPCWRSSAAYRSRRTDRRPATRESGAASRELAIAHAIPAVVRAHEQLAVDELIQQFLLFGPDEFRRQLVADLLLQLGLAVLPGLQHEACRHVLAVHAGRFGGHRRLELDAPENENDGDGPEEHRGEPARDPVANFLQHRSSG